MSSPLDVRFPTTPTQAVWGERRAGGTDVMDRLRHGRVTAPHLVDLRDVAGLAAIEVLPDGGLRIGAGVTLQALADDPRIRAGWPALAATAGGLGNPQIRRMATLGGNLLQRTRCAWFRSRDFQCHKSGGTGCPAVGGDHHWNSIFGPGPCVAPHPSTVALALLCSDARVEVTERGAVDVAALYGDGQHPDREHTVTDDQLVVAVVLPPPPTAARAGWFRAASRARAEWPLVEAVIRLAPGATRVAVGGVAPVPLRLPAVEAALEAGDRAGALARAADGASTNPASDYKRALLSRTLQTLLERLESP